MESSIRRASSAPRRLTLILLLLASSAAAQSTVTQSQRLKNIELCNGADRASPEPQIQGCTALIDSGNEKPHVLAIAYNNRGNAYVAKRDYDRAIEDYDQSIKLIPGYAKPFNNRGLAYQKKGEYERAIKDFDEAIKLDPNYASAFANRADTYQKMNEYDRAFQDFDEAIRLAPNLAAVGMDAVGPAPSLANCRQRWRTATEQFSCSRTMPPRTIRVD